MSLADHWNDRYENNPASKLSWFQESSPEVEFITVNVGKATPVIDIGGGLSPLVHQLIDEEFTDLTVVDVSEFALEQGQRKAEGRQVQWIQSDLRDWTPTRMYGLWHDRAVFHFLTDKEDQERYLLMAAEASIIPSLCISDLHPSMPTPPLAHILKNGEIGINAAIRKACAAHTWVYQVSCKALATKGSYFRN